MSQLHNRLSMCVPSMLADIQPCQAPHAALTVRSCPPSSAPQAWHICGSAPKSCSWLTCRCYLPDSQPGFHKHTCAQQAPEETSLAATALPAPPEEQPQRSPTSPALSLQLGSLAVDSYTRKLQVTFLWLLFAPGYCRQYLPGDPCVTGILLPTLASLTVSSCSQSSRWKLWGDDSS